MDIPIATPAFLRELYEILSDDGKTEFRKQLAQLLTPGELLVMVTELPKSQQFEFTRFSFAVMVREIMPLVVHRAAIFLKDNPQSIHDTEFEKKLLEKLKEWGEHATSHISELEREKVKDLIENAVQEKESYTKGPRKRAEDARLRREKVKELMGGGIDEAGPIRRALEQQGIKVKLKTVKNDMASIRHP
ncbi:MAG: hypothetical protein EXR98_23835 [Gemmataceae bacterium]|nr:hypothetical protein [Gemmataceae bacterium]